MSRTLFTADLHLGHSNIIKFCNRPFSDINEHDEALIRNWNAVVSPNDRIYVVGDFANKIHPSRLTSIFERLHGQKHLILGNHDPKQTRALPWTSVNERLAIDVDGQRLLLDHYPGRSWHGSSRGVVQLYGHVHGRLPDLWNAVDVGVDRWNYAPCTWPQIRARLAMIPKPDFGRAEVDEGPSGPRF